MNTNISKSYKNTTEINEIREEHKLSLRKSKLKSLLSSTANKSKIDKIEKTNFDNEKFSSFQTLLHEDQDLRLDYISDVLYDQNEDFIYAIEYLAEYSYQIIDDETVEDLKRICGWTNNLIVKPIEVLKDYINNESRGESILNQYTSKDILRIINNIMIFLVNITYKSDYIIKELCEYDYLIDINNIILYVLSTFSKEEYQIDEKIKTLHKDFTMYSVKIITNLILDSPSQVLSYMRPDFVFSSINKHVHTLSSHELDEVFLLIDYMLTSKYDYSESQIIFDFSSMVSFLIKVSLKHKVEKKEVEKEEYLKILILLEKLINSIPELVCKHLSFSYLKENVLYEGIINGIESIINGNIDIDSNDIYYKQEVSIKSNSIIKSNEYLIIFTSLNILNLLISYKESLYMEIIMTNDYQIVNSLFNFFTFSRKFSIIDRFYIETTIVFFTHLLKGSFLIKTGYDKSSLLPIHSHLYFIYLLNQDCIIKDLFKGYSLLYSQCIDDGFIKILLKNEYYLYIIINHIHLNIDQYVNIRSEICLLNKIFSIIENKDMFDFCCKIGNFLSSSLTEKGIIDRLADLSVDGSREKMEVDCLVDHVQSFM